MADVLTAEEDDDISEYQKWMHSITVYEEEFQKWEERGKKIIKRYKDERNVRERNTGRFNILWSNVQTLLPATYNAPPIPNIERRFKDDDDTGRVASEVLERSVSYFIEKKSLDSIMRQVVLDRLLPGRGTVWARYVPTFKDAPTGEETDDAGVPQELEAEEVVIDFVHWQDFGHTVAKTWEEVEEVWRIAYLDRDALIARFGEELGKEIPLDHAARKIDGTKMKEAVNKAAIYEIWCKKTKSVYWLSKAHPTLLDERPDPLGLENFFPCPKPVYATLTTDSLVPIADYYEYQDQASELDELTSRITQITKAVKVAGVYDSSAQGIQRLLAEGVENTLIPIDQWAIFADKGGMQGVMQLLPLEEIVKTLLSLYDARERVKADLYEITGMSDIIRGNSDPSETATAQKIKGQYASLRLNSAQKDVARFAKDIVQIMAEIIAEHFSLDTIKNISGVKCLTQAEKQQIMMQQQQQQMMAQPGQPPAPPLPDKLQELMDGPTWEDIEALLKNQQIRSYRIDIETDSTIKADEDAEKQARVELVSAIGGFLQQATQAPPEMQPFLMDLMMFAVRANKAARPLEGEFELMQKKLRDKADAPPPPPEQPPADHSLEVAQINAQTEQMKVQSQERIKQAELQSDQIVAQTQAQSDQQIAIMQAEMEKEKARQEVLKSALTVKEPVISSARQVHSETTYDDEGNRI